MRRSIIFLKLCCLFLTSAAVANDAAVEALAQARHLQLQFRQGNLQVVGPLVTILERAVAQSPGNVDLWQALGNAYMSQQGALYQSQPDPKVLIAVGERAQRAFARALAMDPKNALLQASHGMASLTTAMLKNDALAMDVAVEEMNSAVRRAPKSTPVRLTRGFTIIHLPVAKRDSSAVVEDLNFVMETAPGGRPEDVLHVLLGDVHVETGKLDAARREYEQVTGASSFAAEQARARLIDLKNGAISAEAIGLVRAGTGSRCVMCHAPGDDH